MKTLLSILIILSLLLPVQGCRNSEGNSSGKKSIVVTYSVLGSIVTELVGDQAAVSVSIPDGMDPHEWEPSARDIEALNKADLVVQNGLGLENGMGKTLENVRKNGVRIFTAADYITIRHVGPGEGIPSGDPDQALGAADPHLWTDPLVMKDAVNALADVLNRDLGLEVSARAVNIASRLDNLNQQITDMVETVPPDNRKLVTGHESMGYFAQRYGFKLIGVIIPGLSSQAEVSASDLAALRKSIQENNVNSIFTELGTSAAVANAIGKETGVKVVELPTHNLPEDSSYFTFLTHLAGIIIEALR